jgi:cytidylate kinase
VKLIVIYGPSAAGKHTVGRQLAKLTGYKFFYNHLTVDVVRALFDDDDRRRLDDPVRNLRGTIDHPSHINLDTSLLTPLQSAQRIIEEFKL